MTTRWLNNVILAGGCWVATTAAAQAQSSSLYGPPDTRPPLTLEGQSWVYLKIEPPREVQLNDIVTVLVTEKSQVLTDAQLQRRTQSNADIRLQNWIKLDGIGIVDNTATAEPRARGQVNTQARTTTQLNSSEAMTFSIAARVVDIRPNGQLVLEAHDRIQKNEEIWEQSLSGVVRREDILPNNTVLSEKVNELRVEMRERGHVRDSIRRGWLFKLYDTVKPF